MFGDYKLGRFTRRCSVLDRPLEPGEIYHTVVTADGEDVARREISAEAWTGLPEGALGSWKNRVPPPAEKKRELAPPAVLVDLLEAMASQTAARPLRYLLALHLLRTKAVSPAADSLSFDDDEPPPADRLFVEAKDGRVMEVIETPIAGDQIATLQADLMELIYREVDDSESIAI